MILAAKNKMVGLIVALAVALTLALASVMVLTPNTADAFTNGTWDSYEECLAYTGNYGECYVATQTADFSGWILYGGSWWYWDDQDDCWYEYNTGIWHC